MSIAINHWLKKFQPLAENFCHLFRPESHRLRDLSATTVHDER